MVFKTIEKVKRSVRGFGSWTGYDVVVMASCRTAQERLILLRLGDMKMSTVRGQGKLTMTHKYQQHKQLVEQS